MLTLLIIGCATTARQGSGGIYHPRSLSGTPVTELVRVEIVVPRPPVFGTRVGVGTARLVAIDSLSVQNAGIFYVTPGSHIYTFSLKYVSKTFCSGPLSGRPAYADFVQPTGHQEPSRTALLLGEYDISVTAVAGELVTITPRAEPDCKYGIEDYFSVATARQPTPE